MIVAWIWSLIWYLGLDPIKWMMMYALNEDGIRNKNAHKEAKRVRSERAACQHWPCFSHTLLHSHRASQALCPAKAKIAYALLSRPHCGMEQLQDPY